MMFGGGMIFFWIILLIGIMFVVKYFNDRNLPQSISYENKKPLQILQERYAKGEINRVQFESMKRDLGV